MRPRLTEDLSKLTGQVDSMVELRFIQGRKRKSTSGGKTLKLLVKEYLKIKVIEFNITVVKGGNGYTEDAATRSLEESYPHLVDHCALAGVDGGEVSNNQLIMSRLKEHGKLLNCDFEWFV